MAIWVVEFSSRGYKIRKAKLRQPTGQTSKRQDATKIISIGPILFLYYEESLVSSNLNSNLLRFHCVRPSIHTSIHNIV